MALCDKRLLDDKTGFTPNSVKMGEGGALSNKRLLDEKGFTSNPVKILGDGGSCPLRFAGPVKYYINCGNPLKG